MNDMRSGIAAVAEDPTEAKANWQPKWHIGDSLGATIDDHCVVVLVRNQGDWKPTTHVPLSVFAALSANVSHYREPKDGA